MPTFFYHWERAGFASSKTHHHFSHFFFYNLSSFLVWNYYLVLIWLFDLRWINFRTTFSTFHDVSMNFSDWISINLSCLIFIFISRGEIKLFSYNFFLPSSLFLSHTRYVSDLSEVLWSSLSLTLFSHLNHHHIISCRKMNKAMREKKITKQTRNIRGKCLLVISLYYFYIFLSVWSEYIYELHYIYLKCSWTFWNDNYMIFKQDS